MKWTPELATGQRFVCRVCPFFGLIRSDDVNSVQCRVVFVDLSKKSVQRLSRRDLAFPDCSGEPGCAGEDNFLHDGKRLLLILRMAEPIQD